jgi:DNA repair exonuclease SbcCD ATPase subunit
MPKNLRKTLDSIESSEKEMANLQAKADKLNALVQRQKRIISEQEGIIEEQKTKLSKMSDVPEDILELKELIGEQRIMINEKDLELEYAKGEVAQSQKELELIKKQIGPSQAKLEEAYGTMGNLRAELAEKNSELILRNEAIKSLENKVKELEAFTDKFKEEQVKMIQELEEKHRKETLELKEEINKLDTFLMDSKLTSTEKTSEAKDFASRFESMRSKYDELIAKVGDLSDKNRDANEEVEKLNKQLNEIKTLQKDNIDKINYYDKLKPIMEKEPLFKTFLIIEEVGGITLDDLKNALGIPIVTVKKNIQTLEGIGLIETDDREKIVVKSFETV